MQLVCVILVRSSLKVMKQARKHDLYLPLLLFQFHFTFQLRLWNIAFCMLRVVVLVYILMYNFASFGNDEGNKDNMQNVILAPAKSEFHR